MRGVVRRKHPSMAGHIKDRRQRKHAFQSLTGMCLVRMCVHVVFRIRILFYLSRNCCNVVLRTIIGENTIFSVCSVLHALPHVQSQVCCCQMCILRQVCMKLIPSRHCCFALSLTVKSTVRPVPTCLAVQAISATSSHPFPVACKRKSGKL